MSTIKSGQQLRDTLNASVFCGVDGTDKTYSSVPVTKTLRGVLLVDCTATSTTTILLGSPRVSAPPDGTALATATKWRVVAGRVQFPAGVTASDSNYKTFTINHYSQAGLTAAAAASLTTKSTGGSGTVVIYQSVDMTVSQSNAVMVSSGTLACDLTYTSNGVVIPAGTVVEVDVIPEI